ncbi:MAG: tRNA(Ile)-lysidine synthase [Acidobacteriaceae bacterium]|nr:tRNA(Ile)-lysidine synthase [Acidobacteriaceae bacterium]
MIRLAKKLSPRISNTKQVSERLQNAIQRSGLIREGDRVGVAVSGGADSVALLMLLVAVKKKIGITLSVLHFNHKLRGGAADADEKFVATVAHKFKLPFYSAAAAVKSIAKTDKANVEATARRLRYAFFPECASEHHLDKIAVAHTADDQAETVLAHILRGSGLAGLGGIHPQVDKIVRPLLSVSRADLRSYLKAHKQTWREDVTNRDTSKMRARIRKKLIPLLKKEFQPRIVEHLASLSSHAREDDALLHAMAEERLRDCLEIIWGGASIRVVDLLPCNAQENGLARSEDHSLEQAASTGLSGRLLRLIIARVKSGRVKLANDSSPRGEFTALHVRQVLELARHGKTGSSLPLPGNIEVRRHRDALVFCARESAALVAREYEYKIDSLPELNTIRVPELGCVFRFTMIDWHGQRGETRLSGEVLDEARLNFPLTLRSWRYGDRFCATGHSKPEKLKRLFNEKGIDRWQRAGWPVVVSGKDLAWSRSFGASAKFAAHDGTKTGIVIVEEKSL